MRQVRSMFIFASCYGFRPDMFHLRCRTCFCIPCHCDLAEVTIWHPKKFFAFYFSSLLYTLKMLYNILRIIIPMGLNAGVWSIQVFTCTRRIWVVFHITAVCHSSHSCFTAYRLAILHEGNKRVHNSAFRFRNIAKRTWQYMYLHLRKLVLP